MQIRHGDSRRIKETFLQGLPAVIGYYPEIRFQTLIVYALDDQLQLLSSVSGGCYYSKAHCNPYK